MFNLVSQVSQKIDANFEAMSQKLANAGQQSDNIASQISSTKLIVADLYQAFIDEITNINEKLDQQKQQPKQEVSPAFRLDSIQDIAAEIIKQTKAQQDSDHLHHHCHHVKGQAEEAKGPEEDPVDQPVVLELA